MPGFDNNTMYADNVDFRGVSPVVPQITTDGQLLIGSTATPNIRTGALTSPDSSITFSYSSPNITAVVAGGTVVGKTITGNTGGALSPTAGNWNLLGTNSALTGFSPYTTGSGSTLTFNMPGTAKWVVNPIANLGTHTTIQAAITASSSGDIVFITAGSYTENLTLKAGVILTSFADGAVDITSQGVNIAGVHTLPISGICTMSGIRFTNGASNNIFLDVGSSATQLFLYGCTLNCSGSLMFNFVLGATRAVLTNCMASTSGGSFALFSLTNGGTFESYYSKLSSFNANPGVSLAPSGSTVKLAYSQVGIPITFTSSTLQCNSCSFFLESATGTLTNGTNVTTVTSGTYNFINCSFNSGTSSAISIGSGTVVSLQGGTEVTSSNTNTITGAGTLNYAAITFSGSSAKINATTQVGGLLQGGLSQDPSAGFIGETISSLLPRASATSLSNNTAKTVTSIDLTPGIWNISCVQGIIGALTGTNYQTSISTTTNTLSGVFADSQVSTPTMPTGASDLYLTIPNYHVVITANTTYFLVAFALFTVGTATVFGRISATRVG